MGRLVERAPLVVAAGAALATPLARRGGVGRRRLVPAVVGPLFGAAAAGLARRGNRSPVTGLGRAGLVASTCWAIEAAAVRTGVPFGRFRYTDRLRPQIAGVPVAVPLAWVAMAVPAREAAHAALADRSTPVRRVALGAVALTAWDLFLDPQMVAEGYWRWSVPGRYRGIPAANYLGWLAVSLVAMAMLEVLEGRDAAGPPDPLLVGTYAATAGLEVAAFATFLRDPVVAVVGAAGMVPVAAAALVRLVGQRS